MQHVTLLPLATRTTGETGATQELRGDVRALAVHIQVTAVSGTGPTLETFIEDSPDGAIWASLGSIVQSSVGIGVFRADRLSRFVRARTALSGTAPSFTFQIQAVAR